MQPKLQDDFMMLSSGELISITQNGKEYCLQEIVIQVLKVLSPSILVYKIIAADGTEGTLIQSTDE